MASATIKYPRCLILVHVTYRSGASVTVEVPHVNELNGVAVTETDIEKTVEEVADSLYKMMELVSDGSRFRIGNHVIRLNQVDHYHVEAA